ncbi:Beta-glucan synthesis-associated protein KRE6 [Wickerhamomyces ciferrii]|uniref:Beta-glucan synthesis-associated protein KRE6 n=1 Tax=Wickerhamomyces ciferrii (strain ATCC 14091 / BCRC 22168 / CBS 111 / JCM 3599 / NBRC 0793 / NRRL Y-1031 F-60-10) TaxID=1206466 RepID=K0KY12_WICCF|nr:Beta-glucan synthesis-associated protein KRE6 [Wickerhamomyces ciferrii]CCH46962.1 Beta-glucan synthesis-associated protein KRE6 [Wickerhamomyces ciferrii]
MSTRNLTDRSPIVGGSSESSDSDRPRNPFLQDEENSVEDLSDDSRSNLQQSNVSKPYIDYSGYYSQQGSSSASLTPNNQNSYSSSNISGMNQQRHLSVNNDIYSPPEYDRYPTLGGSRVASMAPSVSSTTNLVEHQKKHSMVSDRSSTSDGSSNPFMADADFSPFGGYPASSFPLHIDEKEPDDYIHNPDPIADAYLDKHRFLNDFKNMDKRSGGGLFGLLFLLLGAIAIFIILPALTYSGVVDHGKPTVIEILTFYSYPQLSAIRTSLVDPDTPQDAYEKESRNGDKWKLVFSDEFNAEGRTFYEGDDQFWNAPNIHYDATHDLEWYDPDASTTINGTLTLRMDAFENHDLFYRSGMLQSWNQMCFTQGYLEVSSKLPNYGNVTGLWPGIWTLGNLARPGFLASAEAVWPYSYDSCDAGITPNQSSTDGISYLYGQRLSACTCDGEDHPNPGTGRGAPELDILEGEVDTTLGTGLASQSFQVAPYDIWYIPDYDYVEIHNHSTTVMNTYTGGPLQQAVSAVTTLNPAWYEFGDTDGHYFQNYGLEYLNDNDDGYIRWHVGQDPTMTLHATALHPNGNIGWRRIPKEPMSIILNLGISNNWAYIDWASIMFPVTHQIDHVRLYQPEDQVDVTCDPTDYPTYDYIQSHKNVYYNANLTTWKDAGYDFPKNILTGNCKSSHYNGPTGAQADGQT